MHHKVCSVRGSHFFRILGQRGQVTASTYREDPFAVAALEACLVVGDAVGREEVDEMDGLLAGRALVLRAGERHGADASGCGCTHSPDDGIPIASLLRSGGG